MKKDRGKRKMINEFDFRQFMLVKMLSEILRGEGVINLRLFIMAAVNLERN